MGNEITGAPQALEALRTAGTAVLASFDKYAATGKVRADVDESPDGRAFESSMQSFEQAMRLLAVGHGGTLTNDEQKVVNDTVSALGEREHRLHNEATAKTRESTSKGLSSDQSKNVELDAGKLALLSGDAKLAADGIKIVADDIKQGQSNKAALDNALGQSARPAKRLSEAAIRGYAATMPKASEDPNRPTGLSARGGISSSATIGNGAPTRGQEQGGR